MKAEFLSKLSINLQLCQIAYSRFERQVGAFPFFSDSFQIITAVAGSNTGGVGVVFQVLRGRAAHMLELPSPRSISLSSLLNGSLP